MGLKIYIKQTDLQNAAGQQIHYAGPNPMSLNMVTGGLPLLRQWANYGSFIDVTDNASDLNKLSLTWTTQRNDEAEYVPGANQPKKSASGTIRIEGAAFDLLRNWLVNDVSAALNSADVKIEDEGCGYYENYIIRSSDLHECEGQPCVYDVIIKQKDEALNCIKRTLVSDNWQGWFNNTIDPTDPGAKRHPRFSYCNEIRPNGMLIVQWWLTSLVMFMTLTVMIPLLLAINPILFILGLIENILGANWNIPKPISFNDIIDSYLQYYVESAGCGREHPMTLVRDYITNVCLKCGVEVDHITAPILFNTIMYSPTGSFIDSEGKDITGDNNPHYNACYGYAPIERGIRRFEKINFFGAPDPNNSSFYLPDNRPLLMLDEFLDQIKGVYNAEWYVKGNKLYFWRKDWFFTAGQYVYDFTDKSPDRNKILEGVCFEPTERKYPAFVQGLYTVDGVDTCGDEAMKHMNGSYSFGDTLQNPNYEGRLDKTRPFGATKFRLDGASTDYILDAMQVVLNGAVFMPQLLAQMKGVGRFLDEYADYALLLKDDKFNLPKLVIWDGDSYMNAKAIKPKTAWPNNNTWGIPPPDINPTYPTILPGGTTALLPWIMKHFPETFVRGSSLSLGSYPIGTYKVQDYFGIDVVSKPALLVNYPMYFEPHFKGTLWDLFHYIDDPERNPKLNKDWNVKIALCCEDLQHLQVFLDANNIKLGEKVKLPNVYNADGIITEITVSYDFTNNIGMYIEIKGIV